MLRIAIGGIASENSSFNSLPTVLDDFQIKTGDDVLSGDRYPFLDDHPDVEFVGTLQAGAMPGGNVDPLAFSTLRADLLDRLGRAGDLDAVYFDLHGALEVEGGHDAEGELIDAARDIVGRDKLIACSLDLHGKVTSKMARNANILTAYRTAPHIDAIETRARAVRLLVECVRAGIQPSTTRIGIPMAMPGDVTNTNFEPMAGVYRLLDDTGDSPRVLDASLLIGHCWTDRPYTMANAVACGTDVERCHGLAAEIAANFWRHRSEYHYGVPAGTMDECISWARRAVQRPAFITDSGDNPTGGGVGDLTFALERLIAADVTSAVFASIPDAAAVDAMFNVGEGGRVSFELGGKLDRIYGQPLPVSGAVARLEETSGDRGHTRAYGRQAVLDLNGISVIVTERRTPFHYVDQYRRLGLDPSELDLVVVKLGYLQPELAEAAGTAFLALTPGAICQDLGSLPYRSIQRPIYPLDPDTEWRPPAFDPSGS